MEDKSTQEYRTLNREISKEIRKHRRQQNTEKIRKVIEKNQSLKILRNSTMGRKEIQKIKDMHGNIVTHKQEILHSIKLFYQELYTSKQQGIRTDIRKVINQGSEEIPEITEEEIISALRDMKNNRAAGDDGLVIESIQEGGPEIIKALNVLFNKCIEEEITPSQWNNATIIIVHKKGDVTDLKNYRPISLLSHVYKLFTKILTKRLTNKIDFFLSSEQAGFRSGYGTNDHLLTVKVLIEKCIEYNRPLMLVFVDFEKAFDSVDQWKLLETLSESRIDHRYSSIIRHIYDNATANVRISTNQCTDKFNIDRGVRQGDTLSPKLFVAVLESMLKMINWDSTGINIDGKLINHLCFADDIILITDNIQEAQNMLDMLNDASEKVGLKINLSKTQYMTNLVLSGNLNINNIPLEQVHIYKYLGHEIGIRRDNQTHEILRRIGLSWAAFGKLRHILRSDIPICLRRKIFNQCVLPVLTYGAETLTLTKKNIHRIQVMQRKMERSMLGVTLRDKIPNHTIRNRTGVRDAVISVLHLKWNWAGHVARMTDGRWTKRLVEWRPRHEAYRSRGRPPSRWTDDIKRVAGNWIQVAQNRRKWLELREAFVQQWTV